ncbi:MAG: hypothetical protein QOH96_1780, partial [Blastocatellia bacterium]|nr:hypothetical protein [Blastocatellia bacterium]
MPFQSPNLDDRDFNQLVEEGKRRIARDCPQWTDLSPGDPGIVLLEVFAYLTETMIYRLNRLPEKAYIEFLRLIGVKLNPPSAAVASLKFSLKRSQDKAVAIPAGTRMTLSRGRTGDSPPVFATTRDSVIQPGQTDVDVDAYHCEQVLGELAGVGTGLPGLSVSARRPPIVAPIGGELELIVAIEATPDELQERTPALEYNGRAFRIWREVDNFSNLQDDRFVYIVDRVTGMVTFAPSAQLKNEVGEMDQRPQALAEIPKADAEIRLWYFHGGGAGGNVAANTLTTLKDQIPGISVTNPQPATGGRDEESLQNALIRGPRELHSLQRAVTAN